MENAIYEKINPLGELDELKIYAWYSKGKGIYARFQPVHRHDNCETSMLLGTGPESGLSVFVKELKRKSQKQEDAIFAKLAEHSKEFAELYNDWNVDCIKQLCYKIMK